MRLYLPATLDDLALAADGAVTLTPRVAHAVTPELRAALPDEDEEGLEFSAHLAAADDSLAMLAVAPAAPQLRLVVTVDVPTGAVREGTATDAGPSAVELVEPVGRDAIVCVHVDEPALRDDVRAALAGDEAAAERVAEADLLWYDVAELAELPR
ncbi:MAG: hypothetical protein NVV70_07465 [Cellulomonas sp.]|uniref:DUF6912 family protein n=1 Tax=Cellulomonas sp. TaxID=40001 RepID=UPI0025861CAA|nr:hypothetical protein [Cellulomonas sp.]MCR6647967.1 hypothetical protein [Cellulomonas sp.]MCR6703902.1 hypothetical protein [Cellulomonas sp.]